MGSPIGSEGAASRQQTGNPSEPAASARKAATNACTSSSVREGSRERSFSARPSSGYRFPVRPAPRASNRARNAVVSRLISAKTAGGRRPRYTCKKRSAWGSSASERGVRLGDAQSSLLQAPRRAVEEFQRRILARCRAEARRLLRKMSLGKQRHSAREECCKGRCASVPPLRLSAKLGEPLGHPSDAGARPLGEPQARQARKGPRWVLRAGGTLTTQPYTRLRALRRSRLLSGTASTENLRRISRSAARCCRLRHGERQQMRFPAEEAVGPQDEQRR
eukprot:scaffold5751_cov112-Isochrysis_galbana.AAC.2